ncbi:RecQ family ATP-dependent DNA helicase [Enterococcus sp. LJL99]
MELTKMLNAYFGFETFKPGQREVIEALLNGEDTLAVLPTGTGKSLCYQFVGKIRPGLVIIVSPLISLMEDQVMQLQLLGEKRVTALNSNLTFFEKRYIVDHLNEYNYLFVSPETLNQQEVKQKLIQQRIALFVVDEAHCISQWGIDFRPEYLKIAQIKKELNSPLTLALTATATVRVRQEIQEHLFSSSRKNRQITYSVNRPNIGLIVDYVEDKKASLLSYLSIISNTTIIYCATRKRTEEIAQLIQGNTDLRTGFYHGGLEPLERKILQEQFIGNQLDVLCATNAFGMGIDKSDIRLVIHYDCPDSLENYVQEIGRAGRDGGQSLAILLYHTGDESIHYFFQNESRANRDKIKEISQINSEELQTITSELNEFQQKIIAGYLADEFTLEEFEQKLLRKEQERREQLADMLDYIDETSCRRSFIQHYFSEKAEKMMPQKCCNNCGLSFDNFKGQIVQSPKEKKQSASWEEILLRLFKETN